MQWTGLNELRSKFLSFFESKDHIVLPSAPLVPRDDNSLLLINSGMAPLKKYFTGMETPPRKRATSCQKCIRTPDIERVGKTARHGTYFEMLGNFSFGDYFKHEATAWAWEFITKTLEMPVDRLWVSIYENDDEAFEIWTKEVGVSPERIVRLGREDNFWEIGSGPCGPCSEIYFDRGEKYACANPNCAVGCDCDRYVEFWNLVFTQFDSDGQGNYTPLEHPNIDTGMGLERLACIMQGVENLFEVDTVARIMGHICEITGTTYKKDAKTDVSLRVITDHIRSTTFMIGDGIVPQNEGRGYVLRRLLRRAARHGRLLGVREPFLYKVCHTVIDENKSAYPNLDENRDYIVKVIRTEEERFAKTIDRGMELLAELIAQIKALPSEQQTLSGEQAFRLYDTFGFPLDLTREILEEQAIGLDEEAFSELMKQQRERARAARAGMGDLGWEDDALSALEGTTQFVGYGQLSCEAGVRAIVRGGELAGALSEGDTASVVLDITPFYAESGGQAGDIGEITTENGVFEVTGCIKSPTGHFLHNGRMKRGTLLADSRVTAAVSAQHRLDVMRNHTAAHLLQWALREVLGTHVHQAGQLVNAEVCRFDFTHFAALTHEELARVEQLVNAQIFSAQPVTVESMSQAAAKEKGAMALFSEKYGDTVRVVDIGGKSMELCGGTHTENTSHLGLFKILKESSVAAGVRRVEAVTGWGAVRRINELEAQLTAVADVFKTGTGPDLAAKAAAVLGEIKERDRRIDELNSKLASVQLDELIAKAVSVDGVRLIRAWLTDVRPEEMRVLGDRIKERSEAVVAVLGSAMEKKASILAVASKQAVERGAHAGKLVRELSAKLGGSGGGRPDSAMGGGSEPSRAQEALDAASALLGSMIKR